MYDQYWRLTARPFHNSPDPKFFVHAPQYDEALMKLTYAVSENLGAALLTGAYGCGKILLSRVLVRQLGAPYAARSCWVQPGIAPLDLLRAVARAMTDGPVATDRAGLLPDALLDLVARALEENRRDGKHTLLIVDEAHLLDSPAALETLRLLLNLNGQEGRGGADPPAPGTSRVG